MDFIQTCTQGPTGWCVYRVSPRWRHLSYLIFYGRFKFLSHTLRQTLFLPNYSRDLIQIHTQCFYWPCHYRVSVRWRHLSCNVCGYMVISRCTCTDRRAMLCTWLLLYLICIPQVAALAFVSLTVHSLKYTWNTHCLHQLCYVTRQQLATKSSTKHPFECVLSTYWNTPVLSLSMRWEHLFTLEWILNTSLEWAFGAWRSRAWMSLDVQCCFV